MKNDLSQFEKNLLKDINLRHRTNYTYKNLAEWSADSGIIQSSLEEGEIMYRSLGCFVAINPKGINPCTN